MKEVIVRYADNGYGNAVGEIVGELVRCEECKHREKNHHCVMWGQPYLCKDGAFCSYGERRADEHI